VIIIVKKLEQLKIDFNKDKVLIEEIRTGGGAAIKIFSFVNKSKLVIKVSNIMSIFMALPFVSYGELN
jgi:hypothetical protein